MNKGTATRGELQRREGNWIFLGMTRSNWYAYPLFLVNVPDLAYCFIIKSWN